MFTRVLFQCLHCRQRMEIHRESSDGRCFYQCPNCYAQVTYKPDIHAIAPGWLDDRHLLRNLKDEADPPS